MVPEGDFPSCFVSGLLQYTILHVGLTARKVRNTVHSENVENSSGNRQASFDEIVVRSADIILKGKNRPAFERCLIKNLKLALPGRKLIQKQGKFFLQSLPGDSEEAIAPVLETIPGVERFSFAHHVPLDLELLRETIRALLTPLTPVPAAINTRRTFKQYPLESGQINVYLGQVLVDLGWPIRLKRPDLSVCVDVMPDGFYLYLDSHAGPGGLPVGASGRLVALLSGGIDSPVAARMMAIRGCRVMYAHFLNRTADGCWVRDKVKRLVEQLQRNQPMTRLYLVDFGDISRAIIASCPSTHRMLVYRRSMIRMAARIAGKEKAKGLVTGDSIGQVASQTLENLGAVYAESKIPILAPLIGFNKQQTVDLARRFGTYDISVLPYQDCCSFMLAKHPETASNAQALADYEQGAPLADLETAALRSAEILKI